MQKSIFTLAFLLAGLVSHAQTLKLNYSFEAVADALFFRYDPRLNVPMSSYVGSIQDWTALLSKEDIDEEEIFSRLDPKFVMFQPRVAGNIHLTGNFVKLSAGIGTGHYQFRNFSWNVEGMFRYQFKGDLEQLSVEGGYMVMYDNSFGPEAAIRSAKDTPKEIKTKMSKFMTEQLFERPLSKGLKFGAYVNLFSTIDLQANYFFDFVKRPDGARNDFASIGLRMRFEQPGL